MQELKYCLNTEGESTWHRRWRGWHTIIQSVEQHSSWRKTLCFFRIGHCYKWFQVLYPWDWVPEHYIFFHLSPLNWSWAIQGRCWYHESVTIQKATARLLAIKDLNLLLSPTNEVVEIWQNRGFVLKWPFSAGWSPSALPDPQHCCHPTQGG